MIQSINFTSEEITTHCERTLQCEKCRKIVKDSDEFGGFKYKLASKKKKKRKK